ncbi:MAG: hypothetical protein H7177_17100 [Rhizobacter sp.]|nr:hypothetical protein [Bacteriovorax sp.]
MKTKLLKLLSALTLILGTMSSASATKIDVMAGFYSFSANVLGKSTAVSGVGTYEISYLSPFKNHFEFVVGYSMTMTGVIGGDYSYGPKLGVNYFPWNFSSNEKISLPNKTIEVKDFYKPYFGFAFNQRQFQSAKSSFAGFGASAGMEKYINSNYTIKTELRMNTYTGPSAGTAKEMNVLVGIIFNF